MGSKVPNAYICTTTRRRPPGRRRQRARPARPDASSASRRSGRAGPGRHATGILADYGAQVISIVQPGYAQISAPGEGGLRRGDTVNPRNKRSLFLNMRAEGALEVFMRLVKEADALLESNRPGAAQRLGIDYESVKKTNPNIIYCSLTGFGQTGPYSSIASHDIGFQAVSGMLPIDEHGNPTVPQVSQGQADLNAAYFGAMAILMGLLGREKTSEGQYIDVSFTDISLRLPAGHKDPMLFGAYPGFNVYETKDGRFLSLSIREPWFWERLCRLFEKEEWIDHIRPKGSMLNEIFSFLRKEFKTKPLSEWMTILKTHDIEFGPVNSTMEHLLGDVNLKDREMILETNAPDTGETEYEPGFGMKFSETPAGLERGPSMMGTDTEDILSHLGYSSVEREDLKRSGATA